MRPTRPTCLLHALVQGRRSSQSLSAGEDSVELADRGVAADLNSDLAEELDIVLGSRDGIVVIYPRQRWLIAQDLPVSVARAN